MYRLKVFVISNFSWLLVLLASSVGVANSGSLKLTLHQEVSVISTPIRLGDVIARVEGQIEPKQLKVLNELKLKPAPLPGRPAIELTARSVGVYLRVGRSGLESVGLSPDLISIEPSSKVLVGRKSHDAGVEELERFVLNQVKEELYGRFPAEYEVRVSRKVRQFVLPFGKTRYSLRPIPAAFLSGALNAYVDIFVDEDKKKSIVVPLEVQVTTHVLVAKQEINRYQPISVQMLSQEEQTFTSLRRVPLKLPEVAGSRSKTRINQGEYLLKKDVELTPKVLIGSEVPIIVQLKGVVVRATGKVLTDGYVGERVKVVNQASKKTLVGIVTENGEIAVSP